MEDDNKSKVTIIHRICCSVITFFVSNFIWTLLSFVMIAMGLTGFLLAKEGYLMLPSEAYLTALILGGFSLIVITMGLIGAYCRVELCFILFIFFAALGLLANILGFAFLVLYVNDVSQIQSIGSFAINGDSALQKTLESLALEDAEAWEDTQNSLDCCGVRFEVGRVADGGFNPIFETGELCADGNAVTAIGDLNNLFVGDQNNVDGNGNFVPAAENEFIGLDAEFYCMSKFSAIAQDYIIVVGVLGGLIVLIQFSVLVSAGRLYWVPEFLGGWALDDEAIDEIAQTKGLKLVVGQDGPQVGGGGRVLSTIRSQAQRVSFRVRNAFTADPNVPKDAGFMKRFSTNRAVSFIGAGPAAPTGSGGAATEMVPPIPADIRPGGKGIASSMRSMLSRMSLRSNASQGKSFVINPPEQPQSIRKTKGAPPPGLDPNSSVRQSQVSTTSKLLSVRPNTQSGDEGDNRQAPTLNALDF